MAQKMMTIKLILLIVLLTGCGTGGGMSSKEFFKGYLNLEPPPKGISDFSGESEDRFPVFLSRGYYKYRADPSYFEALVEHAKFFETSETNERIHQVQCSEIPQDFSYWTSEVINTQGKVCYKGTFVPYIHYIIYDPTTQRVYHFFEGTRG